MILSGIQPSGALHIGNYLGMIRQMVAHQNIDETMLLMIADMHAITVPQDPKKLIETSLELAALYFACGVDPKQSKIFIQSENPDHAYLGWVFDCITPMGWMERMTQYKDKSKKQGERTSVGLFHYPTLMAADILLYDSSYVPVGEDQAQHIELTRDIAEKFNRQFGQTFTLPKAMIRKEAARVMSLQNPLSKMSKSETDPQGTINLLDDPDLIVKKVRRAVTDSGGEIVYRADKPAISNLLTIYAELKGTSVKDLEARYEGSSYADFKNDLAEVVVDALTPIQNAYYDLRSNERELNRILHDGRDFACSLSHQKIVSVRKAVGLGRV